MNVDQQQASGIGLAPCAKNGSPVHDCEKSVLAFVFGWFAFRSRVSGVYLSIITQALTFALMLGFFRNNFGFGGNNGLTDFKDILGFNVQAETTRAALFSISCVALILAFLLCRVIVASKFGKVLIAIRDAEARTRFLGYRVESYKLLVFTLSACMAGVAGALYVPQVGIINPSEFAPGNSIEAVIWVAVGGRGTLTGAVIGAVLVNYAKTFFTSGVLAPYWLFMLGSLFIGVTLLLPRGVVGTFRHWTGLQRDRASAAAEDGVTEPMSMAKRSPPAMPPAVLTMTASSALPRSVLGKRTRSEPASWARARRLAPDAAATARARRPNARLPANTSSRVRVPTASPGDIKSPSPVAAPLRPGCRGRRRRRWRRAPSRRNGRRVRGQSRDIARPARLRSGRARAGR
jgi:branched-subunit amino acid ABC-type transport system permease component